MKNRPIGVIDSGVGGLTVVKHLIKILPNEKYLYIADHLNCPYGTKPAEQIVEYAKKAILHLVRLQVKVILVACNTVCNFIDQLRAITEIPLIDVITPTYQEALRLSVNRNIGLIATTATIKHGLYRHLINSNKAVCYSVICDDFVSLVEGNIINSVVTKTIISRLLTPLKEDSIDTIIYGCTHFDVLDVHIKNVLGPINYVSCGEPTTKALYQYLEENDLITENEQHQLKILTTGDKTKALKALSWFDLPFDIEEGALDE